MDKGISQVNAVVEIVFGELSLKRVKGEVGLFGLGNAYERSYGNAAIIVSLISDRSTAFVDGSACRYENWTLYGATVARGI